MYIYIYIAACIGGGARGIVSRRAHPGIYVYICMYIYICIVYMYMYIDIDIYR